jgi:hypothetical protein
LTTIPHAARIGLLATAAATLLGWGLRHSEASFADGLRYIHQAEQIDRGAWRDGLIRGIDHPLHPLGTAAAHRFLGGDGPVSWERAALVWSFACVVLLSVPLYLLALDLFGPDAAGLGCLLVIVNPILTNVLVNVLSESSFLLWWTWGLWGAIRFLREGRLAWLPLPIGSAVLAYLTRPEGLLLPAALVTALLLMPLHRATRLARRQWWPAVAILVLGPLTLVGPYMALKGGLGTKPGLGRVLGLAPDLPPESLGRESPLPRNQTRWETYQIATGRMLKVLGVGVTTPLLPMAALGVVLSLVLARSREAAARTWLFLGILLAASGLALVRLHATSGYLTARHGLIPDMILILAAAHGLGWLVRQAVLAGHRHGWAPQGLRPGPVFWAIGILVLFSGFPALRAAETRQADPFAVYRATGQWIASHAAPTEQVLDLTEWSLFFSQRTGYVFATVYDAPADPRTRWVVVRQPHLQGRWPFSKVLRELIAGREPVALVPPHPGPGAYQVRIYDLASARPADARPGNPGPPLPDSGPQRQTAAISRRFR